MRKVLLFVLILTVALLAFEPKNENFMFSGGELQNFKNVDFRITQGSIGINAIGKYADGDYALQEANIELLEAPHTYAAKLRFAIKKGMFTYSHLETLGILYDGNKLWIKYMGKIYKYAIPSEAQVIDKSQHIVTLHKQSPYLDVSIEKMRLRFEFFGK
ncbi:MAG: hypothetical protein PHE67_04990 [Campylobacterales bacterium]|nr:hypothetical protein [Campylobacterales bacterium]